MWKGEPKSRVMGPKDGGVGEGEPKSWKGEPKFRLGGSQIYRGWDKGTPNPEWGTPNLWGWDVGPQIQSGGPQMRTGGASKLLGVG